jgi:PIN domain nuclease of toxin-antitoxin system
VLGVLLDTHAFYWLASGERTLSDEAMLAIGENVKLNRNYVSPITAWELALAARKPNNAPQFGDSSVGTWFRAALRSMAAQMTPINQRIALEAAAVVAETGHKDPGDCYLIATARARKIPIVTRDGAMLKIAARNYLRVIRR